MINKDDQSTFAAQWERWHSDHELQRARPHGFLAVTGLHWLDTEPRRYDDAPGSWSCDDDGVRVQLADREVLFVDDRRVCDEYRFDGVDELGIRASFGDAIVEICRRNEHFVIRPRHPDHANRTGYRGTPTYPANTDWVIRGRLTPHDLTADRYGRGQRRRSHARLRVAGRSRLRTRGTIAAPHCLQRRRVGRAVLRLHRRHLGRHDVPGLSIPRR